MNALWNLDLLRLFRSVCRMLRHAPHTTWRPSSCRAAGRWGMTPRQVSLCRSTLEAMPHLAKAAQLAVTTCRQVFADRRWNCSSLESAPHLGPDLSAGTHRTEPRSW